METSFVEEEIRSLLKSGSIVETKIKPKVVNPLSVSTNPNAKKRLILDLRYVNQYLKTDFIKFDDWRIFQNYVDKGNFAYKFDLSQGYHHVDIFEDHQTYLGFSWVFEGKTRYFVFTVLPFGLASAPYIFTKILRPLVSYWHDKGIKISVYLDDGAGTETSYKESLKNSEFVRNSLCKAGFIANEDKSVWEPSQELTWLGLTLNCETNIIRVTEKRISSIENSLLCLCSNPFTSARKLAKIAGKIVSTKFVLGNLICLKTKAIHKVIENRSSWDASFNICNYPEVVSEIMYWRKNIRSLNYRDLSKKTHQFCIFSDASCKAIGAKVVSINLVSHRMLEKFEAGKNSTWRELKAVEFSMDSFKERLCNSSVEWFTDNYAASVIISSGSNKKELQEIALNIFDICNSNNITITPKWIPRDDNQDADAISKIVDYDDWEITNKLFNFLNSKWGPLTVDRFANSSNTKLQRFNVGLQSPLWF